MNVKNFIKNIDNLFYNFKDNVMQMSEIKIKQNLLFLIIFSFNLYFLYFAVVAV